MTANTSTFRLEQIGPIGDVLTVIDVHAVVPGNCLPRRVELNSATIDGRTGPLRVWQARHEDGLISLPHVQGSGEDNLLQLKTWLARHGFRDVTPEGESHPAMPPVWERAALADRI